MTKVYPLYQELEPALTRFMRDVRAPSQGAGSPLEGLAAALVDALDALRGLQRVQQDMLFENSAPELRALDERYGPLTASFEQSLPQAEALAAGPDRRALEEIRTGWTAWHPVLQSVLANALRNTNTVAETILFERLERAFREVADAAEVLADARGSTSASVR